MGVWSCPVSQKMIPRSAPGTKKNLCSLCWSYWSAPGDNFYSARSIGDTYFFSDQSAPLSLFESPEHSILFYDSLEQPGNSNMGDQSAPVTQNMYAWDTP